tara:strand:+ start:78 stop:404 length:327 start_codon:yes stop_codon:yes gene_type:complete
MCWGDDVLLTDPRYFLPYLARAMTYTDVYALSSEKLSDICIYIYIYTHIHICTCVHMHICAHTQVRALLGEALSRALLLSQHGQQTTYVASECVGAQSTAHARQVQVS